MFKFIKDYIYSYLSFLKEISYYNELIAARKAPYFTSDRYDYYFPS